MKKIILILTICSLAFSTKSQTDEKKWNIGFHGGLVQYKGDLGNGFFSTDQASYAFAGLSVSRYLNKHFDVSLFFSRGELGYIDHRRSSTIDRPNSFLVRHNTANLVLKFYFVGPKAIIRPYILVGGGLLWYESVYQNTSEDFVFSLPTAGAGLNIRFGPVVSLQIQETFVATTADNIDNSIA